MRKFIVFAIAVASLSVFSQISNAVESGINVFDYVNAGVSYNKDFLGKNVSSLDYGISRYGFYIQSKSGTGFFYNKSDNSVNRDTASRKWKTSIHNKESGFQFGKRLPVPGLSVKFGFSHREFEIDPFNEYVYQGTCQPCIQKPGFTDTYSNPYYFNFDFDVPGPWRFGAGYRVEKLSMITTSKRSVRTTVYGLSAARKFDKVEVELNLKRYNPSEQPKNKWDLKDNALYELGLNYSPVKYVNVRFAAGMYTDGLPVAGGVFSDVGEMFAFQYLGAETQFQNAYEKKAGYMTLGLELMLK